MSNILFCRLKNEERKQKTKDHLNLDKKAKRKTTSINSTKKSDIAKAKPDK